MAELELRSVSKSFGSTVSVRDLNVSLEDGELLVLVGPSGCGKTTSLRMIAGLEQPTTGHILIGNRDVTAVSAGHRNIGIVFQSYALYPHMSVYKNLMFGPTVRREPRATAKARAEEVAELLGLSSLLDRKPSELSGGQRQRVALGRALLRQPDVFLLDEPLSNLDAALRTDVREELARLHQRIRVTTVYVTHDQIEAMSMADRIGVMFDGTLAQIGTPMEVFDNPVNIRVATFIGSPQMNTFDGHLVHEDGRAWLRVLGGSIPLSADRLPEEIASTGRDVVVGVRPNDISMVGASASSPEAIKGVVDLVEPLGGQLIVSIQCQGSVVRCQIGAREPVSRGDNVHLVVDPEFVYVFDPKTGASLGRHLDKPGQTTMPARGTAQSQAPS